MRWLDTATLAGTPPRARSKAYAVLRTLMNNAVHDELIAVSPVQIRGAGVARRKHEIEPASVAELDAVVAAMPERLRLAVLLATSCALRYGEIAELRRQDVNVSTGQVRIARSVSFLPGGTKVGPLPFWWPHGGAAVAGSGMTQCPCRSHDPGGVVAGPGGVG